MVDRYIAGEGIRDPATLQAMRTVPRHEFVPPGLVGAAYENRPLPIGLGQTISQPYIVAYETEIVRPREGMKILEVGTGSGYQAAVLHMMLADVYSIEVREGLARSAAEHLAPLVGPRLHLRVGDGFAGWPEAAPFDAIVLTAAPERMPLTLVEQLAPGGRLVAPIGGQHEGQDLIRLIKHEDGQLETERLISVRFVPMTPAPQST